MRNIENADDVKLIINTIKKHIIPKEEYNSDNTEGIDVIEADRHGLDRLAECIFEYYLDRTNKHIDLVIRFAHAIADDNKDKWWSLPLKKQSFDHDSDKVKDLQFAADYAPYLVKKYGPEELTCNFELTDTYKRVWKNDLVVRHCKENKHHPEGWDKSYGFLENNPPYTPKMMDEICMTEMLADWMAVGLEQGNTAMDWFNKTNGPRWIWSNSQKTFIFNILNKEEEYRKQVEHSRELSSPFSNEALDIPLTDSHENLQMKKSKIYAILDDLKSYDFGIVDYSTNPPSEFKGNDSELVKKYKLQVPIDTMRFHCGTCWDIARLAKLKLNKIGLSAYNIYYECDSDEMFPANHMTCVIPDERGLFVFESSWSNHIGIHGPFANEEDVCKALAKWQFSTSSSGRNIAFYRVMTYPRSYSTVPMFMKQVKTNPKIAQYTDAQVREFGDASTEALSSKVWTERDINSVADLKRFYKECRYSLVDWQANKCWKDTHHSTTFEDWEKNWKLLTPAQVLHYKCGICYDTAVMNDYFLTKWHINHINLFGFTKRSIGNDYNDDPTHTFTVYQDTDGKWKWLEGSWASFKNNKWYSSDANTLICHIGKALANSSRTTNMISVITRFPRYGVSMNDFYHAMKTQIMNPKFEIEPEAEYSHEAIIASVQKNIKNNLVYHSSPKKFDVLKGSATGTWSGEQGNVFVTPLKGIAACFIISKADILTALEKQLGKRVVKCNFGYDVWNWSNDKLQDIPKQVTVMMNIRGFKPFKGQSTGYLYTIDFSQYKDKCHMFNKNANSDVEFLIEGDVKPMKVEQITVNWVCVSSEEEIKRKGEGSVEGFKDLFKTDQYSSYSWSKFKPIYLKKVSNILSSKDVQSILSKPTHMTYTWNDYKDLIVYAKKYLDTIKKLPNSNSTPIDKFTNIAIALGKSLPKLPRPQYRVVSIKESGILNTKLVCACVDEGNRIAKELHNATVVYSGEYDKILKQAFEIHPSGATYLCDDISDLDRKLHKFCMSSEGSAEDIITPTHTTVVITPDYVVDVPRGKTIETKDGQKLYCRPEDGTIEYMTGSVESFIPSMEAVSTTSYYRISYGKTGIYQALKDHLTKDEWGKFLGSDEAKWLPKPTCEYKKGYKSYFTEAGYKKFLLKTDKYIKKYLKDDKIVIAKYDDISHMNIVYRDQYQIVTNGKEEPTRTVVSNENLKFSNEYEPPYNAEQMLQAGYSKEIVEKLSKDPVHSWRMKTGIELIHIEPSKTELMRIWHNWNLMPIGMKNKSNNKAKELFHCDNATLYSFLLPQYTTENPDRKALRYPTLDEIKEIESNPKKMNEALFVSSESLEISSEVLPAKYKNINFADNPIKKKLHSLADPYYSKIGSHGWNHIYEVMACAYELKGKKPLDNIEYAIIALHDIGRSKVDEGHAELSEKIARKILPKHHLFTDKELEFIYSGILEHSKSYRKQNNITEFSSPASELMTNADKGFPATELADLVQRPILWILEGSDKGTPVEKEYNYYATDQDIARRVIERLHHYFDDEYAKAKQSSDLWYIHFLPELKKRDSLLKHITEKDIIPFIQKYRTEYGFESLTFSTEALPANIKEKRKKIEAYILSAMKLLDPHTDVNQKYWKNKFASMSDSDFDKFMNYIKEKKCNIHMFVPPLKVHLKNAELIEAAHKLGVKLMHRIWMTDENTGLKYLTPEEYLVIQLPIRRQQQFLDEKMSVPDNDKTIDGLTGQVTGDSKACAITNPEIHVLQGRNLNASLYEFANVRGGNIHNYAEFKRSLEETGSVSLNSLDPNNRTRVAVMGGVLLNSMMIENNLTEL